MTIFAQKPLACLISVPPALMTLTSIGILLPSSGKVHHDHHHCHHHDLTMIMITIQMSWQSYWHPSPLLWKGRPQWFINKVMFLILMTLIQKHLSKIIHPQYVEVLLEIVLSFGLVSATMVYCRQWFNIFCPWTYSFAPTSLKEEWLSFQIDIPIFNCFAPIYFFWQREIYM